MSVLLGAGVSGSVVFRAHLHEPEADLARCLHEYPNASQHVEGREDLDRLAVEGEVGSAMLDVVSVQTAK